MEDRIATIIRDWLNEKFGNPDALPNLVLKGLAEEINKHRWEIHTYVQAEYDMEDIETIADDMDIELTDDEKARVLHRYKKLEDSNLDTLEYIIEEIKNEREEQK